jgi:hypothetical protein
MGRLPCCERHRKPPSFACTEIQYSHTKHDPFKLFTDMQGLTLLPHYVDMGDLPELVVSLTKMELLLKQNSLQQLPLPLHLEECPFPVCNIPLEQLHPEAISNSHFLVTLY